MCTSTTYAYPRPPWSAGRPQPGFATAMGCIAHGRVHISSLCVGMAERLVDESVEYARTRRQSGKLIGSFQLVQGLIADSMTDYYAYRATVLEAARAFDA